VLWQERDVAVRCADTLANPTDGEQERMCDSNQPRIGVGCLTTKAVHQNVGKGHGCTAVDVVVVSDAVGIAWLCVWGVLRPMQLGYVAFTDSPWSGSHKLR